MLFLRTRLPPRRGLAILTWRPLHGGLASSQPRPKEPDALVRGTTAPPSVTTCPSRNACSGSRAEASCSVNGPMGHCVHQSPKPARSGASLICAVPKAPACQTCSWPRCPGCRAHSWAQAPGLLHLAPSKGRGCAGILPPPDI